MTAHSNISHTAGATLGASRQGWWPQRRQARGVSMLFFLMAIPVIFTFAAVAIDFTRILEAHRSLEQAAEEAAQSGAMSYNLSSGVPQIIPTSARTEAMRNWNTAVAQGVVTASRPSMTVLEATPSHITVQTTGYVEDLIFLQYFGIVDGGGWEVTARGEARVCLAGFDGEEVCTRPDGRR